MGTLVSRTMQARAYRLRFHLSQSKSRMHFRRATSADIDAIFVVRFAVKENVPSNPARVTREMCEDYLDKLGRGWVCEVEDRVVGFSYAALADHSIWALFVLPEFEGRGIGKHLLKLATDWLFAKGATQVVLSTQANTRADRFYREQGWERGEMKDEVEVRFSLALR
jgi:GNAT superfamily N-acetyltransferase